jgi:uncharacterized protein (DUF1810 family)
VSDPRNLQRFVDAQNGVFQTAIAELRAGLKRSHWMWFVFPQLRGLGRSSTAIHYGIGSLDEARAYLDHPVLGTRLNQSVEAILRWIDRRSAEKIFGPIDAMKLRSSLTLFDLVAPESVFAEALAGFFGGERDGRTLALLNAQR